MTDGATARTLPLSLQAPVIVAKAKIAATETAAIGSTTVRSLALQRPQSALRSRTIRPRVVALRLQPVRSSVEVRCTVAILPSGFERFHVSTRGNVAGGADA